MHHQGFSIIDVLLTYAPLSCLFQLYHAKLAMYKSKKIFSTAAGLIFTAFMMIYTRMTIPDQQAQPTGFQQNLTHSTDFQQNGTINSMCRIPRSQNITRYETVILQKYLYTTILYLCLQKLPVKIEFTHATFSNCRIF